MHAASTVSQDSYDPVLGPGVVAAWVTSPEIHEVDATTSLHAAGSPKSAAEDEAHDRTVGALHGVEERAGTSTPGGNSRSGEEGAVTATPAVLFGSQVSSPGSGGVSAPTTPPQQCSSPASSPLTPDAPPVHLVHLSQWMVHTVALETGEGPAENVGGGSGASVENGGGRLPGLVAVLHVTAQVADTEVPEALPMKHNRDLSSVTNPGNADTIAADKPQIADTIEEEKVNDQNDAASLSGSVNTVTESGIADVGGGDGHGSGMLISVAEAMTVGGPGESVASTAVGGLQAVRSLEAVGGLEGDGVQSWTVRRSLAEFNSLHRELLECVPGMSLYNYPPTHTHTHKY